MQKIWDTMSLRQLRENRGYLAGLPANGSGEIVLGQILPKLRGGREFGARKDLLPKTYEDQIARRLRKADEEQT